MRRAELIVEKLLESAAGNTYVIIPGGGAKTYSQFQDFIKEYEFVADEIGTLQFLIDQGYSIILQTDADKYAIYSKVTPIPATTDELAEVYRYFNWVNPKEKIFAWTSNAQQRPAPVKGDQVFSARHYMDKVPRERDKVEKEIKKEDKKQGEYYINVNKDPTFKEEFTKEYGNKALNIQGAWNYKPCRLGFTFYVGQKSVDVAEVTAGPARKAGMESNDRIVQVGPYKSLDGKIVGPYSIRHTKDFKLVLSTLQPDISFPIRVIRGAQAVDLVLIPEAEIIKTEVQNTDLNPSKRLAFKPTYDEPKSADVIRQTRDSDEFPTHLL